MKEIIQYMCPFCKHITTKDHEICPACGRDNNGNETWVSVSEAEESYDGNR